jgi:hypothetical protein
MRFRLYTLTFLGLGLLALPAYAQSTEEPADKPAADTPADSAPAGDSATKQKLLDAFDTNKDGTLDRSEAREIGRALRENFDIGPPAGRGPEGRGPEGRRRPDGPPPGEGREPEGRRGRGRGPEGRGPDDGAGDRGPADRGPGRGEGRRGPEGRGPEGRGPQARGEGRGPGGRGPEGRGPQGRGPGGPDGVAQFPRPERLFNRFDENQDGSLSKEEFTNLTDFMRQRFAMWPPMGRGGPGRGGFDGPPRGDFERRGGEGRRRGDRPQDPPPVDGPKGEEAPI